MLADGVRLVRTQPGAVAVWALVYFVMSAGIAVAMEPILEVHFEVALGLRGLSSGEALTLFGEVLLIALATLAIMLVLFAATQRAALRPEERGFAYLRLGMDELRLMALALVYAIAFYVAVLAAAIVVAVIGGLIAGILGDRRILAIAGWIEAGLFIVGGTWCLVRLSLSFPLTFARRRFVVGEAWRLSRGRFWTLFGAYFAIAFATVVPGLAAGGVTTEGQYFADVIGGGFDLASLQSADLRQLERQPIRGFDAVTMLGWILYSAVGTLALSIAGGALAISGPDRAPDEAGAAGDPS